MKIEDYFKYYIQGSDHYLIPKDVFEELFDEMSNWRDESKQLKEVIEEVREYIKYYLLDNSWFKDSQNEFKKLLQILDKGESNE